MKKITLLAAVLGASYFANAQVGIGIPTPVSSTQLDVTANDKGILIPRVPLTAINEFKPIVGTQTESLLVYNSNGADIPTGFYYWVDSKWNRIVGKAELDQVIENLGDNITNLEADVKNIQTVINYILPSNPSNDATTPETHTTVVYKDGKFYTVTYDATTQTYTTQEINFEDMVNGFETKTFMKEVLNAEGKVIGMIYFSEQTIIEWLAADPANTIANIPNNAPGAMPIKVKDIVVNNIQEILESPTNITITTVEGDRTFTTVEEYLQYITQFSNGNVIYTEIADPANAGQTIWVFQYWDEATNTYKTIDIQGLVEAAETNTTIVTYNNKQYYLSEAYIKAGGETDPANWTAVPAGAIHVDVVGGVINNIQEILESPTNLTINTIEGSRTFTTVEEYIQYISQYSDGNVVYREIDDPANAGQKIWVFQYWDEATNTYKTINIKDLVEAAETNTTIVVYNNKQYYLSEAYIKAGGETDPANWTAVPAGAIHIDVVGGVINNIQEILESPTNITITTTEGDKTFTTVEEYLQYISQYSNGNVIYTEIADPNNAGQTIWVFQYWDEATNTYKTIDIQGLVEAAETNTTIVTYNNKQYYLSEAYIKAGGETDPANWTAVPAGAIHVDVVGGVINNIQEILESPTNITITTTEGDKTFTTVEEYLQYISQYSDGNVVYREIDDPANAGQKIWVFQYWDEATNTYKTIDIQGLVEAAETNTTIVTYNNKQYYLSEAYIKAGGETDPANWTAVPAGAIHVDVVGGVINNIQEILESPTNITITTTEGDKTFTTVEEYLQYISQYSDGNVVYREIDDPANAGQKIWVFQYWDEASNSYKTIDIKDLVAQTETKTQIKRTEVLVDGTLPTFGEVRTAPVAGDVKKGEIFYEYNAEGDQKDYINMTEDILNSINNNEEIKNAITNVLNLGGNVYFGDHDNDDNTPAVFYQVITKLDGTKENKEIELPASFLVNLINKYKDIVKQALGDTIINEGDTVFTGNVYNGYKVYLGKGATTIQVYSAVATPVSFASLAGDKQIRQVLGIKLLNATGHIVTESTTDVTVETGTTVKFNIGVGNQYMMLPAGAYEVVVEYASNEQVQP